MENTGSGGIDAGAIKTIGKKTRVFTRPLVLKPHTQVLRENAVSANVDKLDVGTDHLKSLEEKSANEIHARVLTGLNTVLNGSLSDGEQLAIPQDLQVDVSQERKLWGEVALAIHNRRIGREDYQQVLRAEAPIYISGLNNSSNQEVAHGLASVQRQMQETVDTPGTELVKLAHRKYMETMAPAISPYLDNETLLPTFFASFPEPISLEEWMEINLHQEYHALRPSDRSSMIRVLYGERVQQERDYITELHRSVMGHGNLDRRNLNGQNVLSPENEAVPWYNQSPSPHPSVIIAEYQAERRLAELEPKEYRNIFLQESNEPASDQFKTVTKQLDLAIQEGTSALNFATILESSLPGVSWYEYPGKGLRVLTWEQYDPEFGSMEIYYATYADKSINPPARKTVFVESLRNGSLHTVRLRTDRSPLNGENELQIPIFTQSPSLLEFQFDTSSPDKYMDPVNSYAQEMLVPYDTNLAIQGEKFMDSKKLSASSPTMPLPSEVLNTTEVRVKDSSTKVLQPAFEEPFDPDATITRKVGKAAHHAAKLNVDKTKTLSGNETGFLMGDTQSLESHEPHLVFYPDTTIPGSTYVAEHELMDLFYQRALEFKTALGRVANLHEFTDPNSPRKSFIMKGYRDEDDLHEMPLINRYDYEGIFHTDLASSFYFTFFLHQPTGIFTDFVQPQGTPPHPPKEK